MTKIAPSQRVKAMRVDAGQRSEQQERLAEETPVALVYNGQSHVVMMATPADLDDFAFGFSLTEGIVDRADEIRIVDRLDTPHGISLEMHIAQARFDALEQRGRNLTGRTGCGLCGAATLAAAIRPPRRVISAASFGPSELHDALARLEARQPLNDETGAVHAAAVIDTEGQLHVREDVGRHNALDKAVGGALRAGCKPRALLVTSRASYEIVHKAAQVGIGLVAAISAPTALALRVAEEAGVVLIGFARGQRLTIYAGDLRSL
jgi:formate dehydrogenase accessory protein FdhD